MELLEQSYNMKGDLNNFRPSSLICQVDETAFQALENCISKDDFDTCEGVAAGESSGFLINPIGGIAVDMMGPAR